MRIAFRRCHVQRTETYENRGIETDNKTVRTIYYALALAGGGGIISVGNLSTTHLFMPPVSLTGYTRQRYIQRTKNHEKREIEIMNNIVLFSKLWSEQGDSDCKELGYTRLYILAGYPRFARC